MLFTNIFIVQIAAYCKGSDDQVISCMMAHRLEIDAVGDGSTCNRYLKSMTQIFFSDYHLVKGR